MKFGNLVFFNSVQNNKITSLTSKLVPTIIFYNILRLFDVLPNFSFTTSETMGDYYLETWYIPVDSRVAERLMTEDLRKYQKVSKPHRLIESSLPVKMKVLLLLAENS